MNKSVTKPGFTIVELLIVIVVIGILAAITLVAFNGIQDHAKRSALQEGVANGYKKLEVTKIGSSSDTYPASIVGLGLTESDNATYEYFVDTDHNSYCLSSTIGAIVYSITSTNSVPFEGGCYENGMLGWWPLNGNAEDAIGTNDGVVTTPTPTTGQNGIPNSAYNFIDGQITIAPLYNGVSAITKSLWARMISNPTSYSTLFDNGNPGYSFYIETSGAGGSDIMFGARTTDGSGLAFGNTVDQVTTPFGFSTWRHIVQTISDGYAKMYVDGVLRSTTTSPYEFGVLSQSMTIGGGRGNFQGQIDDVRIYNRALSATEVTALYTAGAQ